MEQLKELFSDYNNLDVRDFTTLHKIVLGLDCRDLRTYLQTCAQTEFSSRDAQGYSALSWAARRRDSDTIELLLEHGCDPDITSWRGSSALHFAAMRGDLVSINHLLRYGAKADIRNQHGTSPLQLIHMYGHMTPDQACVQRLLEAGANVNTEDNSGTTPPILAPQYAHYSTLKFLLQRGADPNKSAFDGETALDVAIQTNSHKALLILLDYGANPAHYTLAGRSLLHERRSIFASQILCWVCAAITPFTVEQLCEAWAIHVNHGRLNRHLMPSKQDILRSCSNLITQDSQNHILLAHHSVLQFLVTKPEDHRIFQNSFSVTSAKLKLGELCIAHLTSEDYSLAAQRFNKGPTLHIGPTAVATLTNPIPSFWRFAIPKFRSTHITLPLTPPKSAQVPAQLPSFFHFVRDQWAPLTSHIRSDSMYWDRFRTLALQPNLTWRMHPWVSLGKSMGSHYSGLLGWAIANRHRPLIDILVHTNDRKMRDVFNLPLSHYNNLLPLHLAARINDVDILSSLLPNCDPKKKDLNGWTTIHNCADVGAELSLVLLLDSKINKRARDIQGRMQDDLEAALRDLKRQLDTMGTRRITPQECKSYLAQLSLDCYGICKAAVDGHYEGDHFKHDTSETFSLKSKATIRRLRAVIQYMNTAFSQDLRMRGHKYQIDRSDSPKEVIAEAISNTPVNIGARLDIKSADPMLYASKPCFNPSVSKTGAPVKMSNSEALEWVGQVLMRTRGRELSSSFNPLLVGELFWEQSIKWHDLATDHVEGIMSICSQFLAALLEEMCPKDIYSGVWTSLTQDALGVRNEASIRELELIMEDVKSYPINHNHYYTDTIKKLRQARANKVLTESINTTMKSSKYALTSTDVEQVVDRYSQRIDPDMDKYSCEEALDCLLSIYKASQPSNISQSLL